MTEKAIRIRVFSPSNRHFASDSEAVRGQYRLRRSCIRVRHHLVPFRRRVPAGDANKVTRTAEKRAIAPAPPVFHQPYAQITVKKPHQCSAFTRGW